MAAQFKTEAIDHRRWLARESGWLQLEQGRYVPGPHFPNFRVGHPVVYEQIKADAPKWMMDVEAPTGSLFERRA